MVDKDLYEYLETELKRAADGDPGPRWPSPEVERTAQALRSVFDGSLSEKARERLLVKLGLAALSLLVQRHRAGIVASAAETKARRSSAGAGLQSCDPEETDE